MYIAEPLRWYSWQLLVGGLGSGDLKRAANITTFIISSSPGAGESLGERGPGPLHGDPGGGRFDRRSAKRREGGLCDGFDLTFNPGDSRPSNRPRFLFDVENEIEN